MSKRVLLVVPSLIVARGLERVFEGVGEFSVAGILSDISRGALGQLARYDADVIIVDPVVFDYEFRQNARAILSEHTDAAIVALATALHDEESLRQYDGVISLYDQPQGVIAKVRAALESAQENPKAEGEELSAREKEILVCVAKGMLNKEIADRLNLSIHTVITHRKNITRKIGIKTVPGLTAYAMLNNLIDINSVE